MMSIEGSRGLWSVSWIPGCDRRCIPGFCYQRMGKDKRDGKDQKSLRKQDDRFLRPALLWVREEKTT